MFLMSLKRQQDLGQLFHIYLSTVIPSIIQQTYKKFFFIICTLYFPYIA